MANAGGQTGGNSKALWQKTKRSSKIGFDRLWGYSDKYIGAPVNRLSNKLGSEAFWPTTLDKEADKAARILRSFCKDGFYTDDATQTAEGPQGKQRVIKKIPTEVIQNAKGLAIFTTMRTGLWFSGAGGSGILVARKEDGTWSPPSGIMLHTAGLGFLVGVDIYDCVLVLNTVEAVAAFSKWRATIGGEMSAVAGPVGLGGIVDSEVHKRQAPVFTYLKSRGFYAGVQIDGTVIIERGDENERFYREKITTAEIIAGKIRHPPYELRGLMETLKAAEGSNDVDESALPNEPPPADYEIVASDHLFGVPDKEDPDPYGVLALEKEGLYIKVAGSQARPAEEEFEFRPSVSSPVFTAYNRRSTDSSSPRSSWRRSTLSNGDRLSTYSSGNRNYVTSDTSTQTDFDGSVGGAFTASPVEVSKSPMAAELENTKKNPPPLPPRRITPLAAPAEPEDTAETPVQAPPAVLVNGSTQSYENEAKLREDAENKDAKELDSQASKSYESDDGNGDGDVGDEDDEAEEEPVVHVVHQAAQSQSVNINKAKVVQVQKRPTPTLPPRNPTRMRTAGVQAGDSDVESINERPVSTAESNTNANERVQSIPSSPEKETLSNNSGFSQEEVQVSPPTTPARSPSFRSVKSEPENNTTETRETPGAEVDTDAVESAPIPDKTEPSATTSPVDGKLDEIRLDSVTPNSVAQVAHANEGEQATLATPVQNSISMANIRSRLDSDDDDD